MEQLEVLPSVTRLSDHVVRVLGQNPGKFTLQGTNTYLIGKHNPYVLVDTGEGREQYISVLESALKDTAKPASADEPDVSDIIISHWHPDHVGGLPSVLTLLRKLWQERSSLPYKPPRLHKFPYEPQSAPHAHGAHYILPSLIESVSPELYAPSPKGTPFHDLHDGQILTSSGLRVLHTPGHTEDSICLYIPHDRVLYTADSVLGQGTAVFEDLALYMTSLDTMLHFGDGNAELDYEKLYPGHGPVVAKGKEVIAGYIKHRQEREDQILQALQSSPPSSTDDPNTHSPYWTTWTLVATMYAAYPESLWAPATHSVDLHLRKLEGEGVVKRMGGEGKDTSWQVVDILSSSPVDQTEV